jgi:hypothetical protein
MVAIRRHADVLRARLTRTGTKREKFIIESVRDGQELTTRATADFALNSER